MDDKNKDFNLFGLYLPNTMDITIWGETIYLSDLFFFYLNFIILIVFTI